MRYLNSKKKFAGELVPIFQELIDFRKIEKYVEPFCGGCNIIDKIRCPKRFASDNDRFLIALYQYVKNGGRLLDDVSRDMYLRVARAYKKKTNDYIDWVVGCVAFLASRDTKTVWGGFAAPHKSSNSEEVVIPYQNRKNRLLKQMERLKDVVFECCDYSKIRRFRNAFIYCDPPRPEDKGYTYGKDFDYDDFWNRMRRWSRHNYVFITARKAPDDFIKIWSRRNKNHGNERLYIHCYGKAAEYYELKERYEKRQKEINKVWEDRYRRERRNGKHDNIEIQP